MINHTWVMFLCVYFESSAIGILTIIIYTVHVLWMTRLHNESSLGTLGEENNLFF